MAVVEPTNEMKSVIGKLREEENRIFFDMIQSIARNRGAVEESARAVAQVDVLWAKAKLGEVLCGVIPEVLVPPPTLMWATIMWTRLFSLQKAPTCETRKVFLFHM
jgi:hypothetical protein